MALSSCSAKTDLHQRELASHGSISFPIACYADHLDKDCISWHWHEEWEFVIVSEGICCFLLENTRISIRAGDGIFINSRALHSVVNTEKTTAGLHSAVFHPRLAGGNTDSYFWQTLVQPLLQNTSMRYVVLKQEISWQHQVLQCFQYAWDAVVQETEDYENLARYQLSKGLRFLIQNSPISSNTLSEQEKLDTIRIRSMLEFIEGHYTEDLTIQDIAESISVSGSVCLRCFHQMLDITPIQYVKHLRLQKAARLLESTSKTSKEIAFECGFNDVSYFIKSFRIKNGCTPKEYRKEYQQSQASAEPFDCQFPCEL